MFPGDKNIITALNFVRDAERASGPGSFRQAEGEAAPLPRLDVVPEDLWRLLDDQPDDSSILPDDPRLMQLEQDFRQEL
ncbi:MULTISPECIES: hypothetical protein [unclassified Bradyrhizobium]